MDAAPTLQERFDLLEDITLLKDILKEVTKFEMNLLFELDVD